MLIILRVLIFCNYRCRLYDHDGIGCEEDDSFLTKNGHLRIECEKFYSPGYAKEITDLSLQRGW